MSQDDLRAAAKAVVDRGTIDCYDVHKDLERALAAPPKPDLLPGLKLALEILIKSGNTWPTGLIRAEIARIEKDQQS